MFCPKCKSLLIPKDGKLVCSCGYSEDKEIEFNEKINNKEIEVVDENENLAESEVPIVCWNCKKRGVYVWIRQMARADEAPTRFYKCKHCKKVWRSSK